MSFSVGRDVGCAGGRGRVSGHTLCPALEQAVLALAVLLPLTVQCSLPACTARVFRSPSGVCPSTSKHQHWELCWEYLCMDTPFPGCYRVIPVQNLQIVIVSID